MSGSPLRSVQQRDPAESVDRLRRIALALPEATERPSHGEVSFFCRKQFVMLDDHHHGADHLAFWAAAQVAPKKLVALLD